MAAVGRNGAIAVFPNWWNFLRRIDQQTRAARHRHKWEQSEDSPPLLCCYWFQRRRWPLRHTERKYTRLLNRHADSFHECMLCSVLVLYGSQTGAAKSIAETIHGEAIVKDYKSTLASLNDYKSVDFANAPTVVIVCSTTGNGDPPNNAEDFWRFIRKRTHAKDMLCHTRFAVLGLGDTNYDKFCMTAKTIHKRMLELGAAEFFKLGTADEAQGLDAVVEPWIRGLWPALDGIFGRHSFADSHSPMSLLHELVQRKASMHSVENSQDISSEASSAAPTGFLRKDRSSSVSEAAVAAVHAAILHVPLHSSGEDVLEAAANAAAHATRTVVAQETANRIAGLRISAPALQYASTTDTGLPAITPGVKTLPELFPMLCTEASTASPAGMAGALPPYDSTTATKGLPKLPPVTWEVSVTSHPDVAASSIAEATAAAPSVGLPLMAPASPLRAAKCGEPVIDTVTAAPAAPIGKCLELPVSLRICNAKYLTTGGSSNARRVIHAEFDVSQSPLSGSWNPGDSIGVIAPNDAALAKGLCLRLGLDPAARLSVTSCLTDASMTAPSFFPSWLRECTHGAPTMFDVFSWCVDVQATPKKTFVRLLAEFSKGQDRDVLTFLCGRSGKDYFQSFFEDQRLHLLDILNSFPTCQPPLSALLSALPVLPPRYYSICCSPLTNPDVLSVAFSVVEYECVAKHGVTQSSTDIGTPALQLPDATATIYRKGLASTWLEALCSDYLSGRAAPRYPKRDLADSAPVRKSLSTLFPAALLESPSSPMATSLLDIPASGIAASGASRAVSCVSLCTLEADTSMPASCPAVLAFLRPSRDFCLPAAVDRPIVMIGPGTGVAPFIGFLEHREKRLERDAHSAVAVCKGMWRGGCPINMLREDKEFYTPLTLGPAYLFFGNRRSDLDFLFQDSLHKFCEVGVLNKLYTAFSREGPEKVYVQHRMREVGVLIADLILQKEAYVYVCGDGAGMAKDVDAALVEILHVHGGASIPSLDAARELLQGLAKKSRYVRDIWS